MSVVDLNNLFSILFWVLYLINVPRILHIAQQESYQNDGIIRWLMKNPKKAFKRPFVILLVTILLFLFSTLIMLAITRYVNNAATYLSGFKYASFIPSFISYTALFISMIVLFVIEHKERKEAKKPLKYTARAKRLIFYNFIVLIILNVFFLQSFSMFYPKEIQEYLGINMFYYDTQISRLPETDPNYNEIMKEYSVIKSNYEIASQYDKEKTLAYSSFLFAFLLITMPINLIIANWFASPLEKKIGERYIKKAYQKLNEDDYKNLIRIGVTGSYGKTSTKYILKTILQEKYNVYATPGSFNTTMGNVRVIREDLKPEHEVFISEMGARKKNDINEICEFVRPHIGIITSIGEQHLETFKTLDNVAKTKGELLKGVINANNKVPMYNPYETVFGMVKNTLNLNKNKAPEGVKEELKPILEDGAVFLNKDGAKCEELYNNDTHAKKFLFSADNAGADIYAKKIKSGPHGSEFTVVSKKLGEYSCHTKLLGKHNVQNIIGAIAIAEYLGLAKEQIQSGVEKIEPVEHRLQLLPSTNGTIVIDDAFNSNPVGSKAALDVIKEFEGRKIIITPGMVELGQEEEKLNKEFGRQMAEVVDIAILVGPKHTRPIQEGLKEKKFDEMNLYVVADLNKATERLAKIAKPGDVILFENDLPDAYNEM